MTINTTKLNVTGADTMDFDLECGGNIFLNKGLPTAYCDKDKNIFALSDSGIADDEGVVVLSDDDLFDMIIDDLTDDEVDFLTELSSVYIALRMAEAVSTDK